MPTLLTRDSEADVLEAFLDQNFEALVPLLPADTLPEDLFLRVEQQKDIAVFFDMNKAADPAVATRALARLEGFISVRLEDEKALKRELARRAKHAKHQQMHMAKKKQKVEPPPPPTMTLDEAAATLALGEAEREKKRRAALLEKGLVVRAGVGPKDTAGDHIKSFWDDPAAACERMGVEIQSAWRASGVVVFLDGPALEKFETIKRAGNPKAKGKDRIKHANFSLPVDGSCVFDPYNDFWNVLVGYAYRVSESAEWKVTTSNTEEQLKALQEAEEAKVVGKFKAKIAAATKKVSKADVAHAEAEEGAVKEAAKKELEMQTANRDGLLVMRNKAEDEVKAKFARMLEVRGEIDERKKRRMEKAAADAATLHARTAAAGGATDADGAAAIAAATAPRATEAGQMETDAAADDAAMAGGGTAAEKAALGEPYLTHEDADAVKLLTPGPTDPEPTDNDLDAALRAAPDKWARFAATDIEASGVFALTKRWVERAKAIWGETEAEQAMAAGEATEPTAEMDAEIDEL